MKKKTLLTTVGVALAATLATVGIFTEHAYAYTAYPSSSQLGYGVLAKAYGTYQIDGGDTVRMTAQGYPNLDRQQVNMMKTYGLVDGDSDGEWQFVQADILGEDANNGYLFVGNTSAGSNNVQDWVNRLGGNPTYVNEYLTENGWSDMQGYDTTKLQTFHFASFAAIVTACAASVTENDVTATGETDADGNPVYQSVRHIQTTNPPTADSISVSNAGSSSTVLTLKSTEDIPWGTYTHHYDAVQITNNSTEQSSWIVGSDESDISDMQVENGGNGAQTDSVTVDTSSFANGSYTATFFVRDGVDRVSSEPATTTFTITSNSDIGTGKTIQLSANPTSLNVGQSSTLTATAISIPSTDYIKIVDSSLSNTLPGNQSSYSDGLSGEKSLVTTATYDKVRSVSYVAQEINETTGVIDAQSPPVTVTWTAPAASITLTPSSGTQVQSGTPVTISYKATGMISGEFVVVQAITDNGAKNAWYDSGDKNSSNFDYEVESPVNGASVSVKYVATIYDGSLDRLATAYSGTITWVSQKPTITITASPQTNVPGEPSEIQYSVNTLSPGDTISVVGTGGSHPWNVSNQTNYVEQYQQIEDPTVGQTITTNYTAYIYDSSGNVVSSSTTSVSWTNEWNGTISLSASPVLLQTYQDTNLRATTSQAIPSGYALIIMDETTGQTVGAVTSTPATVQYANANAETDEFEAFITDGYENIGAPSNTVSVQWVGATVTASPTLLPINQSSTITATAQNKPSTDWLILFNESTGQVLGSTQGSTISTTQTESTAQTDAYLAYVFPSNDVSGAYVTSDPVSVDWYGVTLTATPVSLPVGEETQLTAATQNLPAGYVLDIEDQTTGKVLATGDLSQTTLTTTDTQSSPQTDTYIARIVQPPKTGYGLWAESLVKQICIPPIMVGAITILHPHRMGQKFMRMEIGFQKETRTETRM